MEKIKAHSLHLECYSIQQIYNEMLTTYGSDNHNIALLLDGKRIIKLDTCLSQTIQNVEGLSEEIYYFILLDRRVTIQMTMNETHLSYGNV